MFFGVEWCWWLLIAAGVVISIPFKVKFVKWWNQIQQDKKGNRCEKWGDEE